MYSPNGALGALALGRKGRSRRESSYDRSGKNADFISIKKGRTAVLADIRGAGCIRHIWITVDCPDDLYLRRLLLRIFWDNEKTPSVLAPLGDFFGVGHARASHYMSLPLNMVTGGVALKGEHAAMNCFFPMPFSRRARVEIVNQCPCDVPHLFFYVDYEELDGLEDNVLRFHVQWRRQNPTPGLMDQSAPGLDIKKVWDVPNLSGRDNYIILDAEGRGHYVGCNLSIDNINPTPGFAWFGEGDDMFFIDGDTWPPSLHGTGTEDYFCAAWGLPSGRYDGPYHGVSYAKSPPDGPLAYTGKWTLYRFHIEDPVIFEKSLLFTIEHGHANASANDYSSTAYWYQSEPHKPFPPMPSSKERLPISSKDSLKSFFRTF